MGAVRGPRQWINGMVLGWLLVGLTACAPASDASSPPAEQSSEPVAQTTTAPPAPAEPAPETTSSAPPVEPAEPTSEVAPEPPPPASASACLVGPWQADNAYFLAAMQEFGDEVTGVEGEVVLTFGADGTMSTDYRSWTITFSVEGMAVTIVRHGIDLGEYVATDTTLTLTDTSMGSTLTLSGPGASSDIPPEPALHHDVPYTCDAQHTQIITETGTLEMVRIP